jgi:hypothetical protein
MGVIAAIGSSKGGVGKTGLCQVLAPNGLSVICVQKVPLRKVGKINEIALRPEVISLI